MNYSKNNLEISYLILRVKFTRLISSVQNIAFQTKYFKIRDWRDFTMVQFITGFITSIVNVACNHNWLNPKFVSKILIMEIPSHLHKWHIPSLNYFILLWDPWCQKLILDPFILTILTKLSFIYYWPLSLPIVRRGAFLSIVFLITSILNASKASFFVSEKENPSVS